MLVASDGNQTFVIFSYGDINSRGRLLSGVFSRISSRVLTGSGIEGDVNLTNSSNVGIPGLYIYRVDTTCIIEPKKFISWSKY